MNEFARVGVMICNGRKTLIICWIWNRQNEFSHLVRYTQKTQEIPNQTKNPRENLYEIIISYKKYSHKIKKKKEKKKREKQIN